MTYCLAVAVEKGLVFVSDSRTNAGIDQISIYSKMHRFGRERERQLVLLSAGNLATAQGVVAKLQRDIRDSADPNLYAVSDLHEAADYVGAVNRAQQTRLTGGGSAFEASFILGGQIGQEPSAIMLVYPEGNHITATADTPYLQIGESKYGKPILDRIIAATTTVEHAALCALVSMDSTLRSNVTVGPPIELVVYHRDTLTPGDYLRLDNDSAYLRELKRSWEEGLRDAFHRLPPISLGRAGERHIEGRSVSG
ncbi:MAG: peptidase [Chromatiales bacterium]